MAETSVDQYLKQLSSTFNKCQGARKTKGKDFQFNSALALTGRRAFQVRVQGGAVCSRSCGPSQHAFQGSNGVSPQAAITLVLPWFGTVCAVLTLQEIKSDVSLSRDLDTFSHRCWTEQGQLAMFLCLWDNLQFTFLKKVLGGGTSSCLLKNAFPFPWHQHHTLQKNILKEGGRREKYSWNFLHASLPFLRPAAHSEWDYVITVQAAKRLANCPWTDLFCVPVLIFNLVTICRLQRIS